MYYLYNFLAVMLLIFLYCLISSGAISGKKDFPAASARAWALFVTMKSQPLHTRIVSGSTGPA